MLVVLLTLAQFKPVHIYIVQVQLVACALLSSVRSVNQAFKASLIGVETLEDGKILICPRAEAYGKSGCCHAVC